MKMKLCEDHDFEMNRPTFQAESEELFKILSAKSKEELLDIYDCSLRTFNPVWEEMQRQKNGIFPPLSPALLSFEGIAYRYMGPDVFSDEQWDYVNTHLRILSARYGVLRPLDGVWPYRLELKHKIPFSLYEFWGSRLKDELQDEVIINLASKEYSSAISIYQRLIDIRFFELDGGKRKEKGVYAKIARGSMVRWMAENRIENPEELKKFDLLGYQYDPVSSSPWNYVFVRKGSHD